MREKKMKLLEKVKNKHGVISESVGSSPKLIGTTHKSMSFIRCKSSDICQMFPNSPTKSVKILKHIWDQMYRDQRKHKLMNNLWCGSPNDMCSLMLKLGKHRAKKDNIQIAKVVQNITAKYKSLRHAWKYTPYSWTQFRRFVSVKSVATRKLEYQRKLSTAAIQEIQNHFYSDEISFPVPDKKYAGKRFLRTNIKQCLNMYNVMESTTTKISLSTLNRLRPKQVKL